MQHQAQKAMRVQSYIYYTILSLIKDRVWKLLVTTISSRTEFFVKYTDKKENQLFLICKEIQNGAVAKSYMRKGFLIYEEMRKYFPIWEEAVSHMTLQLLHSEFPYIWEKFDFLFYQCKEGSKEGRK
jgi:hypothetical protein